MHFAAGDVIAFTVAAGSVGYLAVITNDCDRDGEQPYLDSAYLVAAPASGTCKLSDPQTIRYAPNSGFHGTDRLTYRCRDAAGNVSQPVVVTITFPDRCTGREERDSRLPSLRAGGLEGVRSSRSSGAKVRTIQRPVLHCLGHVRGVELLGAGQVGDGAGDFQHAVVGPGREAEARERAVQQPA